MCFNQHRFSNFRVVLPLLLLVLWTAPPIPAAALEINDQAISDAVEDELHLDQVIDSPWIDVNTENGIVTLSGMVSNVLAKKRATRIAETVRGVRGVVNTVEVSPPVLRADKDIADDVEEALLTDPATDLFDIDVGVSEHVVTLSGTVESWQEKRLCVKVAEGVRGVTDVVDNITFTYDSQRSDEEMRRDIQSALRWDVLVDSAMIEVTVADGRVSLRGTVGSSAEKRRAVTHAYFAHAGEVDASELRVELRARDNNLRQDKYRDLTDADIRQAVRDALFQDPRLSSFRILTEIADGMVTLRGTVDNLKAKRVAAATARNTVGVVSVANRLKVRPARLVDDTILESRLRRSFDRDPFLEPDRISVSAGNGIVELIGTVQTSFEKARAEDLAMRVNGVVAVNNHLVINGPPVPFPYNPYVDDWYALERPGRYQPMPPATMRSDAEITAAVERELFWSPFVDAEDIDFTVKDGLVTLTGTVDSWEERRAAEKNALDGGAVLVDNELVVRPR